MQKIIDLIQCINDKVDKLEQRIYELIDIVKNNTTQPKKDEQTLKIAIYIRELKLKDTTKYRVLTEISLPERKEVENHSFVISTAHKAYLVGLLDALEFINMVAGVSSCPGLSIITNYHTTNLDADIFVSEIDIVDKIKNLRNRLPYCICVSYSSPAPLNGTLLRLQQECQPEIDNLTEEEEREQCLPSQESE